MPILIDMINSIKKSYRYFRSTVHEALKSTQRSSKWNSVRDTFLAGHDVCEECGSTKKLQVHHVKPFHLHPELELDEENLITLCMDTAECHLLLGHGDSFRCYNPHVRQSAKDYAASNEENKKLIVEEAKKNRLKD